MDFSQHLYGIGLPGPRREGPVEAMGFKAGNLARMAAIGLPVPQAFVLGTPLCQAFSADPEAFRPTLRKLLESQIERLEAACGLEFGAGRKPLLVSVRSGAPVSMPGMMDTILDVGLTDATLRGLLRMTGNPRLVWDSYRRLIQQYAEVVHHLPSAPFRNALAHCMAQSGAQRPQELDFRALTRLARSYLEIFEGLSGTPFPQDPLEQLHRATEAVFDSWMSPRAVEYRRMRRIDMQMGTAVTVQRMVFGNAGGTSGAGVGFSRDPATGENRLYLDFRFNSQGEDVVSGQHSAPDTVRLASSLPHVQARLQSVAEILEREFGDVQEFEFTVQDGILYLLQTRSAKRTPWAALRIAVEQVNAGLWSPARALGILGDVDLQGLVRSCIGDASGHPLLARATPAGLGVAVGVIALDPAEACAHADAGRDCILVRDDTSTEDLRGIAAAQGILTARGGRTAHAAVVARQLGKACLVGCAELNIDLPRRSLTIGNTPLQAGDLITLDCASGHIYAGAVPVIRERPDAWLKQVAAWFSHATTAS
ncbi:PEP/pyruvate-binding domain-containing protein [Zoogloea sp.]|uniref:PEP/pyruvate-binding domain-containing protein n=1 Tax=Zoogloea sp. TaxID=49181 RepID=UPI0025F32AB0|nr:PEP/pyruvate-binding domain-containing protein [Zoogloea sp.]MCK6395228.1 pyruvate, phosphate dikinase [Zoogloea sp.]